MNDDYELAQQIRSAAMSMLTDEEICRSLQIDTQQLEQHYDVVDQARLTLKQQLNARRLKDAAERPNRAEGLVESIPRSRRGGARPGAGRKPGTTNKISGATILNSVEQHTGQRFEDLLAQGYAEAIDSRDTMVRLAYEKMFLSKVVADRVEMDINESQNSIDAKRAAFAESLLQIAKGSHDTK